MRRAVAIGALVGLVVALGLALAMPPREVRTVPIPAPHGRRVPVYGALQPYAPSSLTRVRLVRSPQTARDALLGLIAGGLVAAAGVAVTRPVRST